MEPLSAVLIDLDGALGDTRPLWNDWLAGTAKMLGVDPVAARRSWRGRGGARCGRCGNWRVLLERFASERAPVYLRPDAAVSAALRRLAATGRPLGVFTDAPAELAEVALGQLGAARRVTRTAAGAGALEALRVELGNDAIVVSTSAALTAL